MEVGGGGCESLSHCRERLMLVGRHLILADGAVGSLDLFLGRTVSREVMAGEEKAGTEIPGGWGTRRVELCVCHAVITGLVPALRIR